MPELALDDILAAGNRGTYNACVDLATQVRCPGRACLAGGLVGGRWLLLPSRLAAERQCYCGCCSCS